MFDFRSLYMRPDYDQITIFTLIALLSIIEIILSLWILFQERFIKKILVTLSLSTSFFVFLIVFFVMMEGLPTFSESTSLGEFITSDEWSADYIKGLDEDCGLHTIVSESNVEVIAYENPIYSSKNFRRNITLKIKNSGASPDVFFIEVRHNDNDLQIEYNTTSFYLRGSEEILRILTVESENDGEFNLNVTVKNDDDTIRDQLTIYYVVSENGVSCSPNEMFFYYGGQMTIKLEEPLIITNTGLYNESYTISIEGSDYFRPSIAGPNIAWNYSSSSCILNISSNSSVGVTVIPRMTSLIPGRYTFFINISSNSNTSIKTNSFYTFYYQQKGIIKCIENEKATSTEFPAAYNVSLSTRVDGLYTFEMNDIPEGWNVSIFYNNSLILRNNGLAEIEFLGAENRNINVVVDSSLVEGETLDFIITFGAAGTKPTFGILAFITNTLLTSFIAICFALPLALGSAIFLAEYCPKRIRRFLRPSFELLAGIPSILYGLWGAFTLGPLLSRYVFPLITGSIGEFVPFFAETQFIGNGIMTASIVLSIMIIPIILTFSEDSIRAVPRGLKEGSLALGATRWETIRRVLLPVAKSGIISSIILAVGRAIGETMAVLMIMQFSTNMPISIFDHGTTMTGVIAAVLGSYFDYELIRHALFAVGLVLFALVFILNMIILLVNSQGLDLKSIRSKLTKKLIPGSFLVLLLGGSISPNSSKKKFLIVDDSKNKNEKIVKRKVFKIVEENSVRKTISSFSSKNQEEYQKSLESSCEAVDNDSFNNRQSASHGIKKRSNLFGVPWSKAGKSIKIERGIVFLQILAISLISFLLLYVLFDVIVNGILGFKWSYLFETEIGVGLEGGFLNAIIGSLQLIGLAVGIAFPLALGAAIYIQEYGEKKTIFTRFILFMSDTLASTPSIVFGAFGFIFFAWYLGFRPSLISGGFTLACMILPILLRSSIESIKAIPFSIQEGSLALGATKWLTIVRTVLPPAVPMIVSGLIIAIGRAIGETAAVMFAAGYSPHINTSLFTAVGNLPNMIYMYYHDSLKYPILEEKMYAASLVLIVMIILMNFGARLITRRFKTVNE